MASYSAAHAIHKTLSGTTVDTCTLTVQATYVEVINRNGPTLWCSVDGSTPTAAGDNMECVLPGQSLILAIVPGTGGAVVKLIGNGNEYSVRSA